MWLVRVWDSEDPAGIRALLDDRAKTPFDLIGFQSMAEQIPLKTAVTRQNAIVGDPL